MIDDVVDLPCRLHTVLGEPPSAAPRFAPALAYGRHRGPAAPNRRQAAVLLAIYRADDQWRLAMTRRSPAISKHANQICFPGGSLDPGETPEAAARREFAEELGATAEHARILGELSPVYVYVSNFLVTPFVAHLERAPSFIPNPAEVAEVVEPSLALLLDASNYGERCITRGPLRFRAPCVQTAAHQVWGASAIMLAEFIAALQRILATR